MGGKRPDQHRIDVDEGGATDYKRYPDRPDETVKDRRALSRGRTGAKAGQPTPSAAPNPDAERARGDQDPELKGAGKGAAKRLPQQQPGEESAQEE